MEKMQIYNQARLVPPEAMRTITAGRLKGFTDINPMWRIKRLTEIFGACGFGWWYIIKEKKLIPVEKTNEICATVDIDLYYQIDDVVSQPIPGTGGSMLAAQEKQGLHTSDEAFKMALTDAISVAAKALGVGADVYYEKDRDKYYSSAGENEPTPNRAPDKLICDDCGNPITGVTGKNGKGMSADEVAKNSYNQYGRRLCYDCVKKIMKK